VTLESIIETGFALDLKREPSQATPTRKVLEPRLEAVLERLAAHRTAVDAQFEEKILLSRQRGEIGRRNEVIWARYPYGFCRVIRDAVFDRIAVDPYFEELRQAGLLLKPVFIFLRESYFQNAIQFGDYYIDVANDSVDTSKPPLDWSPIEKLGYENVDSWARFASVARTYLRIELYPNLHFPLIFPAAPFFAIDGEGSIQILLNQWNILLKDLGSRMQRTLALLDDQLIHRRLPECYDRLLERKFGGNIFEAFPVEFVRTDPATLKTTILPEFLELSAQRGAQAYATLRAYGQLMEAAAEKLRVLNLRPSEEELDPLRKRGQIPAP
jgi:hypothetical protein